MSRSTRSTLFLVRAAVIAAFYVALSFIAPAFGPVQFRLSEALTVLPLLMPEAIIGVTVGCFVANMIGSVWIDALLGSLVTLIAAGLTYLAGKLAHPVVRLAVGVVPPILLNAIVVPLILALCGVSALGVYWVTFATVALGQVICIVGLGTPLYFAARRVFGGAAHRPSPSRRPPSQEAQRPDASKDTPHAGKE